MSCRPCQLEAIISNKDVRLECYLLKGLSKVNCVHPSLDREFVVTCSCVNCEFH